jgi:hypothetical protein
MRHDLERGGWSRGGRPVSCPTRQIGGYGSPSKPTEEEIKLDQTVHGNTLTPFYQEYNIVYICSHVSIQPILASSRIGARCLDGPPLFGVLKTIREILLVAMASRCRSRCLVASSFLGLRREEHQTERKMRLEAFDVGEDVARTWYA